MCIRDSLSMRYRAWCCISPPGSRTTASRRFALMSNPSVPAISCFPRRPVFRPTIQYVDKKEGLSVVQSRERRQRGAGAISRTVQTRSPNRRKPVVAAGGAVANRQILRVGGTASAPHRRVSTRWFISFEHTCFCYAADLLSIHSRSGVLTSSPTSSRMTARKTESSTAMKTADQSRCDVPKSASGWSNIR